MELIGRGVDSHIQERQLGILTGGLVEDWWRGGAGSFVAAPIVTITTALHGLLSYWLFFKLQPPSFASFAS